MTLARCLRPWAVAVCLTPLAVGQGSTCSELGIDFYASFPGLSDDVRLLETFDLGGGPALYAGGDFEFASAQPARGLARWDGSAWSALGGGFRGRAENGGPERRWVAAATLWQGDLVVGGAFVEADGAPARNVARWDGSAWSALGAGLFADHVPDGVQDLIVFDDGTGPALYAAGTFTSPWAHVARWDGTAWSAVGGGVGDAANALAVFDDGSGPALYVGGAFDTAGGVQVSGLARWDGQTWSAVDAGAGGLARTSGDVLVNDIVVSDAGGSDALYVTGAFDTAGGSTAVGLAAWDGAVWSTPGSLGGPGFVSGTALATGAIGGSPSLHVVGGFTTVDGVAATRAASWDGASWTGYGGNFALTGTFASAGLLFAVGVHDDGGGSGPQVYVGGRFNVAGGAAAGYIARRNASAWARVGPRGQGFQRGTLSDLEVVDLGNGPVLVAGGLYTPTGGGRGPEVWDGSGWSCLPSGAGCLQADVGNIAVFDDGSGPGLFFGGWINTFTGAVSPYFRRWKDGAVSVPGAPTSAPSALATLRVLGQTSLYAAYEDFVPGEGSTTNVTRFDGSAWTPVGDGFPVSVRDSIFAFEVFEGFLYAGGSFRNPGGGALRHVAWFDGASWRPVAGGLDGDVYAFQVFDDGSGPALYAGKGQSLGGTLDEYNVVRFDGTSWSPVGDSRWGINGSDRWGIVLDLEVYDDGSGPALYAAGQFDRGLYRWDGSAWTPVFESVVTSSGFRAQIAALETYDDGDGPSLMMAGTFEQIDGVAAYGFAEYRPRAGVGCPNMAGVTFCAGDGLGAACPCTNPGLEGHGCAHASEPDGARLVGVGDPALGVRLQATRLPATARALLMSGDPLASGVPFGEGLLCLGGSVRRVRVGFATNGRVDFPVNSPVPATVSYQVLFRDPGAGLCQGAQAFNLTNGFQATYP